MRAVYDALVVQLDDGIAELNRRITKDRHFFDWTVPELVSPDRRHKLRLNREKGKYEYVLLP
jgi:hypothetical protein